MRNRRRIGVLIIAGCLVVALGVSAYVAQRRSTGEKSVYDAPLPVAPLTDDPMQGIDERFVVDAGFVSHLPLIIIDTGDVRPPISTYNVGSEERYAPIPGVEPYVDGRIAVIDGGGMNRITDAATYTSSLMIKRRGNSSMLYEKAQYLVKLVTESGQNNLLPLLGMAADNEWVLNGSMADKSMLRNYIGCRIGSQFTAFTPNAKYCEVLYYENGQYLYEGVYLLMESIKQGENRIDIPAYKEQDVMTSYIVRRDRYDDAGINLETPMTPQGTKLGNFINLIYPSPQYVTAETVAYITEDISRIERVLYSDDLSVFSLYGDYIDVDSFIDYFIFNEAFGSYDAGIHSTYMYKTVGGKLKIGPIWDFDNALDNYRMTPLQVEVTAFQTMPWFDVLMKDRAFLTKLERRYAELRRGALSDESTTGAIDETVAFLGPAIDREWTRWAHVYIQPNHYDLHSYIDSDGDEMVRDTAEFRQEIYRIKISLTKHGYFLPTRLALLQDLTEPRSGVRRYMGILLIVSLIAFFIPAVKAVRK